MEVKMGLDRIIFFSILFFMMIHIIACFWIFIGKFDESSKDNWIYTKNY
jgi:hypothetical protein